MSPSIEPMNVPALDLKAQYHALRDQLDQAVRSVVESQYFLLGREAPGLEAEGARRGGAVLRRHSASLPRGTAAVLATAGWSRPTTRTAPAGSPGGGSTGWSRSVTIMRSASTPASMRSRRPCSGSSSPTSTP